MALQASTLHVIWVWTILYASFTGAGLMVPRSFGVPVASARHIFDSFWIGFALSIVFLQLWHLFFPVDARPFVLFLLVSISGLFLERHTLARYLRRCIRYWFIGLFLLLLAILIANQGVSSSGTYDDGLYHIQDMRWVQTYSIVPGLGNLHGRFAFNNALSLPWAMIDSIPGFPSAQYVGGGLLAIAMLVSMSWSLWKIIKGYSTSLASYVDLFLIGSVLYIGYISLGFSSLKNDYTLFLLAIVVARMLIELIEYPPRDMHQKRYSAFTFSLLICVGVSIKLCFAMQGLLTLLVMWWILLMFPVRVNLRRAMILSGVVIAVSLAVILPWMYRGILLSGYPLYPEPSLSVDVDWKIPVEYVARERDAVRSWARQPGIPSEEVLANWNWLSSWLQEQRQYFLRLGAPFSLATLTLVAFFAYVLLKRAWDTLANRMWLWLLPIVPALVFWFVSAPNPRFGWHLFWLLGVGTPIIVLHVTGIFRRLRWGLFLGAVGIFIVILLRLPWANEIYDGFRPIPAVELKIFVTDYNLILNVPAVPDQCFDAPIPCAPSGRRFLRLRDPHDMGQGFVIDGS